MSNKWQVKYHNLNQDNSKGISQATLAQLNPSPKLEQVKPEE